MFCKNCGKEIKDGDTFCRECGGKIDSDNISKPVSEIKTSNNLNNMSDNINVDDSLMWILAFTPIIAAVLSFYTGIYGYALTALIYISNCILCYFDEEKLKKLGFNKLDGAARWLVPCYIYKRGIMVNKQNQGLAQTVIWAVLFVITLF